MTASWSEPGSGEGRWKLGRRDAQGDLFRPDNVLRATWARIRSTGYWRSTGASGIATTASARSTKPESDDRVCRRRSCAWRCCCSSTIGCVMRKRSTSGYVGVGHGDHGQSVSACRTSSLVMGAASGATRKVGMLSVSPVSACRRPRRARVDRALPTLPLRLCERAGDSEYLVVNRQSRTHVRTIAPSHQVPVDGSEERPIRTHDQQGVG